MALPSTSRPATSTGPTWATPRPTTASIERVDLDGRNVTTIVPAGGTFTRQAAHARQEERQALLVRPRGHARDARRTLTARASRRCVETGRGDEARARTRRNWCVGIARRRRPAARSTGRRRAATTPTWAAFAARTSSMPAGQTAANRTDIEVLFDGLPEPIDLELDLAKRLLYWTDRGQPARRQHGQSRLDGRAAHAEQSRRRFQRDHWDLPSTSSGGANVILTDDWPARNVYRRELDGSDKTTPLAAQAVLTGIVQADLRGRRRMLPVARRTGTCRGLPGGRRRSARLTYADGHSVTRRDVDDPRVGDRDRARRSANASA